MTKHQATAVIILREQVTGEWRPDSRGQDVEAKARPCRGQGQGHNFLSSRSRTVLEDPIPAAFELKINTHFSAYAEDNFHTNLVFSVPIVYELGDRMGWADR